VFDNPFIHVEDVWRIVGLVFLSICGIAELVAISLAEGHRLKNRGLSKQPPSRAF